MNKSYISLGSNIGNRLRYLQQAVQLLQREKNVKVCRVSSVYETDPVGYVDQDAFLNIVVELVTSLNPHELLKECNKIEAELGRTRDVHWGPRTVDLDILLFNEENMKSENLIIPHPRMTERGFVLIPLVEISPDLKEPGTNRSFTELAHTQKEGVHLWKTYNRVEAFLRL